MERDDRHRHVDEVFRARLSDLNVTPPAEVWKAVESAVSGRKKVRPLTLFRLVAATLLLLVLTGSLWLIYLNKPSGGDLAGRPVFSDETSVSQAEEPAGSLAQEHETTPVAAGQAKSTGASSLQAGKTDGDGTKMTAQRERTTVAPAPEERISPLARRSFSPLDVPGPGLRVPPVSSQEGLAYAGRLGPDNRAVSSVTLVPAEEKVEEKPLFSWGIGATAGPLFSYRNLPVKTEYTRFLNEQEKGMLSYGGSFSFFVKRKKRLSVETGISYYRTGQVSTDMVAFRQIKSGNLALLESKGNNYLYNSGGVPGYSVEALFIANRRDPAGNDQTGYILTYLGQGLYEPVDAELQFDYQFVEVPLVLHYRVIDRAFGVNLMGGMGASLLFDSRASVVTADGQHAILGHLDGLRRSNINSIVGVGFSYRLGNDLLFRMEPVMRYYINPVSNNGGIEAHPFLFGVYSGMSIYF